MCLVFYLIDPSAAAVGGHDLIHHSTTPLSSARPAFHTQPTWYPSLAASRKRAPQSSAAQSQWSESCELEEAG